ncbi:uncharacterized protein LOC120282154 [Dioscorea cayenensis subsp. rotundata]|uniref:Uncharacterized protein LOC120282154 n=1 Tax=Dioscorea cayennensis subsp. rotundata TaxID=55577 RepID=A0AB40D158_DIOCR|nr:uncharacterized protein LOC120282154 [Dioscorea cayenensis subsp. rotundata]
MQRMKRFGVAGVLSYGLLNTIYYLTTFLFLNLLMAHITSYALALAPIVDKGLSLFTVKFNFKSEGKAFAMIVGLCFNLAFILIFCLTFLWTKIIMSK